MELFLSFFQWHPTSFLGCRLRLREAIRAHYWSNRHRGSDDFNDSVLCPVISAQRPLNPDRRRANGSVVDSQSVQPSAGVGRQHLCKIDAISKGESLPNLMRRRRAARLLHFNRADVAAFLSALRTAQSLLQIRELRIPPANVGQRLRHYPALMTAGSTLQNELVLTKLVR